jgi:alkylation response protein AidB-like acyl-CoA dehydrogenase
MDFLLSREQEELREKILAFTGKKLNKLIIAKDKNSEFSIAEWYECADFGLLGMIAPEEYGGTNLDNVSIAIALEAFGYACKNNGLVFTLNNHIWTCLLPVMKFGDEFQKNKYLKKLVSGELIGAHGMTENSTGSDAFNMKTTAKIDGDNVILDGSKAFITNAPIASLFLVFARTEAMNGDQIGAFLVEKDTTGFTIGKPYEKMGLKTSPMSDLYFNNCVIPKENMLSEKYGGKIIFNTCMEWERTFIFASHLGNMKRLMEENIEFAKERKQFNRSIAEYQAISHRIADMKVMIELAQLLLYKVAWLKDQGKNVFLESSLFKLFTSESYQKIALGTLQIHGAYGYMDEIEREVRDSLASTIYSGTSEIQREIISKWLGL